MSTTYKKYRTANDEPIQVDSAIRDGSGKNIENNYAKQNGYYSTLKAGNADLADFADNLTPYGPNSGVEDDTSFIFQTSGGKSDIGASAQIKKLYGASKPWNQLAIIPTLTTRTTNGVTFTNNGDGSVTIQTDENGATAATTFDLMGNLTRNGIAGHKYLLTNFANASATTYYVYDAYDSDITATHHNSKYGYIKTKGNLNIISPRIRVKSGTIISTPQTVWIMYFDLTLIYGAGNEPATVAEFEKDFPLDYYAYDAGSIVSSKIKGYKVVGYNAFDGELELGSILSDGSEQTNAASFRSKNYIKVVPGQKYTYEVDNPGSNTINNCMICEYDANKNFIVRNISYSSTKAELTLLPNTHYIRICSYTAQNTVLSGIELCLHLTWDESKTGYEPYWSETYQFPNVELRGVNDIKDELLPDGTITRRIGIVDLGTLNWNDYNSTRGMFTQNGTITNAVGSADGNSKANICCSKYVTTTPNIAYNGLVGGGSDLQIALQNNKQLYVIDSSMSGKTGAEIKSLLSGIYLIYELATPTTEQVDSYTENTLIDDWGTQEWLSDNVVMLPQPAEFFYSVDYKAFIDSVGNREDIAYDAGKIVSQEQLTEVVNGTRPVNLADVAVDIYSDREVEDADQACPPAVFSSIGGDAEIQDGNNAFEELHGNSVAFGQLVNFATNQYGTDKTYREDKLGFTLTADSSELSYAETRVILTSGHKYIIKPIISGTFSQITLWNKSYTQSVNLLNGSQVITAMTDSNGMTLSYLGTTGASLILNVIDLTQMFGAGNEPETVAEFNALFPKTYYAYNAGELISSKSTGLIIRGMNQFDGVTESGSIYQGNDVASANYIRNPNNDKIRVVSGASYVLIGENASTSTNTYLFEYDVNGNWLRRKDKENSNINNGLVFAISDDCAYVRFVVDKNTTNIMLRLYYDTDNVPFEPYEETTVILPNIELRSAGSISDVAYSTGGGKRRVKELVFDSSTTYVEVQGAGGANERVLLRFDAETITKELENNVLYNTLTNKYVNATANQTYSHTYDKIIALARVQISSSRYCPAFWIYDSALIGKTVAQIKEALAGLIIYTGDLEETDIPLEENPGWQQLININNYGTFEFTSEQTIQVPQAYFVRYTANLVEFLDSAYERADGSADNIALVSDVYTKASITALENGTIVPAKSLVTEQLENVSEDSGTTQDAPFVFQATATDGGAGASDTAPIAKYLKLKGRTYAGNQLLENGNFETGAGWLVENGTISVANNILTATANANNQLDIYSEPISMISGHKYLLKFTLKNSANGHLWVSLLNGETYSLILAIQSIISLNTTKQTKGYVFTCPQTVGGRIFIYSYEKTDLSGGETTKFSNVQLFDLTQLFNGDIPDAILNGVTLSDYGLSFSGVDIFNQLFPLPYYAYNEGTLVSANATLLTTIGKNQFDGEWTSGTTQRISANYIKVVAGQTYTLEVLNLTTTYKILQQYDETKTLIKTSYLANSNQVNSIALENDTHYVKLELRFASSTDIPLNAVAFYLTWDGSRPDFEEFVKHEYQLGDELKDNPLLSAGSVCDEKTPDGTITRRIGVVDLGTLDWGYSSEEGHENFFSTSVLSSAKLVANNKIANIKCARYVSDSGNNVYLHTSNKIIALDNTGRLFVYDSSAGTNPTTFKTAMSGVMLYYELATPTTTQGTPFPAIAEVDDFGTMGYGGTSYNGYPQGCEFFYPADYVLFIDSLGNTCDFDASKIALKSNVSTEETARTNYDTILQNAIGGTLRQLLSVKESLDFEDTDFVDLGSLDWTYQSTGEGHYEMKSTSLQGTIKAASASSTSAKIMSTKYITVTANVAYHETVGICVDTLGTVLVYDTNYNSTTSPTDFKVAMKGVLLAYEKAS